VNSLHPSRRLGDRRHQLRCDGEAAFLHEFAGDLAEVKARALYAVQQPFHKAL
jgi:hypothetical protein